MGSTHLRCPLAALLPRPQGRRFLGERAQRAAHRERCPPPPPPPFKGSPPSFSSSSRRRRKKGLAERKGAAAPGKPDAGWRKELAPKVPREALRAEQEVQARGGGSPGRSRQGAARQAGRVAGGAPPLASWRRPSEHLGEGPGLLPVTQRPPLVVGNERAEHKGFSPHLLLAPLPTSYLGEAAASAFSLWPGLRRDKRAAALEGGRRD